MSDGFQIEELYVVAVPTKNGDKPHYIGEDGKSGYPCFVQGWRNAIKYESVVDAVKRIDQPRTMQTYYGAEKLDVQSPFVVRIEVVGTMVATDPETIENLVAKEALAKMDNATRAAVRKYLKGK